MQRDSGLSKDTLQRPFYHFLAKAPLTPIIHHDMVHLRIDATYCKRFCIICYQDDLLSYTQLFRFSDAESYEEIKEDLQNLLRLGLQIESITSDGHKATLKAIKKVMPNVLVQRCLVHIQRICLLWLTANPTYPAGKELRELVLYIPRIQTHNDKYYWIKQLKQWEVRHKNFLKDIYPGGSSNPSYFTNVNGELYFSALDAAHGIELWKSNGTAAGTLLVKDIYPGSNGNGSPYNNSYPGNLTNVNGTLYFSATDAAHGYEIWKSDGTAAGTVLLKDIYPGGNSSNADNLTIVNGTLYFTAADATHGTELYKSDGTSAGTLLVKDIYPGVAGSNPQGLTNVNGTLYFSATDAAHGTELWKSDGTAAGTVLVQEFDPGAGSGTPGNITVINSITFLTAVTKQYGTELYSGSTPAASAKTLPVSFAATSNEVLTNIPVQLKIAPNPVSNSTTVSFLLQQSQKVSISILDITGRLVKILANEEMQQGNHEIKWNTNDDKGNAASAGIYFLKMFSGSCSETKKLFVIK